MSGCILTGLKITAVGLHVFPDLRSYQGKAVLVEILCQIIIRAQVISRQMDNAGIRDHGVDASEQVENIILYSLSLGNTVIVTIPGKRCLNLFIGIKAALSISNQLQLILKGIYRGLKACSYRG